MKPLDGAAREIKKLIAAPCLVARDRTGRAFFVSDVARRLPNDAAQDALARLSRAGYACQLQSDLAYITWDDARLRRETLALGQPAPGPCPDGDAAQADLWGLCRLLLCHPAAVKAQDSRQLRRVWQLADAGHIPRLARAAGAMLAQSLRRKTPPPYSAAHIIIRSGLLAFEHSKE